MSDLNLFNVIIWAIAGIVNLSCKEVSKFSYAITWAILTLFLIIECFE